MSRRPLPLAIAAVLSVALTAACGGGGGTNGPKEKALAGTWQWTGGSLVPETAFGTLGYLQLDASGSGSLVNATPESATPYCLPLVYAVLGGHRVSFEIPSLIFNEGGAVPLSYDYQISGKTLVLTDPTGAQTTFTRISSVPASAACVAAPIGSPIPIPSQFEPDYERTGLVGNADGTLSWTFLSSGNGNLGGIVAFDPVTQTSSAIFSIPGYEYPQATQGPGDYWLDCFCGHNNNVERYTGSTFVDDVATDSFPVGETEIGVRGGYWDGTDLWLVGNPFNLAHAGVLQQINSLAEPDLLLQTTPLDISPFGLTGKNGNLYVLGDYLDDFLIVELAPDGSILGRWSLPSGGEYVAYSGLGVSGDTLYAIAYAPNGSYERYVLVPISGI